MYFKETVLRSQTHTRKKSKEGKVKEGISLNLGSIIFDLIQQLIDWLFKSVKWRITFLVIEAVLQPVCTFVLIIAVLGHGYHLTDRSEWENY